ncbi:hypothetical protein [Pseudoduganella umbonata]|uniref:Uncharacterized protein n=1 Tax=Pseudoduganella umbonata TaxID=864828 RepID=A0A4P8HSY9_9BURK|nr:hypothetical protein [Pseudoduganella umbonata]MBB3222140.1 hypothetical protein [Pseudoduganella umbonata]QCP12376.1 hypothetical protein FCL38_19595 [Pseudoduganella umbonata]
MKRPMALILSLVSHVACLAAEPEFYVLNLTPDSPALLHTTAKKLVPAAKLPFVVLGNDRQECCFVPRAQPKDGQRSGAPSSTLASSQGEETYQFAGAYRPLGKPREIDDFAFGIEGMTTAKKIGKDVYEVGLTGASPLIVRHCSGTEGINFRVYRALRDKEPVVSYYYYLGYDIEPDCPEH